jgi:hypothetical protein
MPSLTPSRSQDLHDTNQRLQSWFERWVAENRQPAATSKDITTLLSELAHVGAELRAEPFPTPGTDPEFDAELQQYRRNVERLRELLPSIHCQLLVERARLEAQRARLQSADQWARASRQTL